MNAVDLHTLTGAYALGALSGREAAEFARHLAQCEACAREVRELQETAARLALAVAEVPPADLRTRVMAALPKSGSFPGSARGHGDPDAPSRAAACPTSRPPPAWPSPRSPADWPSTPATTPTGSGIVPPAPRRRRPRSAP
ncbi:zf-HC2 domain-containing protein [Streptomyces lydicus]|nr:zf-HC2 domain-containing protein [Streptomyces lydicus]